MNDLIENSNDDEKRSAYRQIRDEMHRQRQIYVRATKCLSDLEKSMNKKLEMRELPVFPHSVTGIDGLEPYEKKLLKGRVK